MSQINSTVLDKISANVEATEKNFKPILTSNTSTTTTTRTSTTTTTITTTLISKTPSTIVSIIPPATTTAKSDIGIPIVELEESADKTVENTIDEETAARSSNSSSTMTGQVLHSITGSNAENDTVINLKSQATTGSGIGVGLGVGGSSSVSSGSTYKIVKTLGKGNFAKVKLAVHIPTGREVAIKIIDKTQLNASAQQKLHREVGIMKMLNHPNIVRLYQVIETDRSLYLVMEYACKGELFDYLVKYGRMKERDARTVFRQLVSAIQYCHSKFVVHRDLKAENLLLDQRMNIKIADFGFGNTFDPKSHLETFCGSPPYAAPELFMGRKYAGPEADSWSLGVVLYTLVSGTLPFDGGTLKELRERVLRGKYRVPYYISMDCENLMRKFLVLNPTKRTSLTAVMGDKWLNAGYEQAEWLRPYRESPPLLNDQTRIDLLVAMGYKRQDVEASVKQQRFDDIYCTYLLLNMSKSRRVNTQEPTSLSTSSVRAIPPRVANVMAEPQTATGPPAKPTRRSVCKSPAPTSVQSRTDSGLPKHISSSPLPASKRQGSVDVKPTLLSAQRKLAQQQKHQHLQGTPTKLSSGVGSNTACTPPPRSLRPTTLYEKAAVESPPTLSFGPAVTKVSMDPSIIDRLKLSGAGGGNEPSRPHSPDFKKSIPSSKSFARNNATRATFHFGQARNGKQHCSGDSDAVLGYPNTPPLSADDTKPAARIGFFSKLTARFGRRTLHEKDPLDQRKNVTK